jgi:hypothetical protein
MSDGGIPTEKTLVPICAMCKMVRAADGSWVAADQAHEHVTHVFCPGCADAILAVHD